MIINSSSTLSWWICTFSVRWHPSSLYVDRSICLIFIRPKKNSLEWNVLAFSLSLSLDPPISFSFFCWHCYSFLSVFRFISFRCLFNIAIVRNEIVKFVKIHSHTNLKLTSSNLHHSPKQHDEHLFNSHSSKKKKKLSSGTGSALSNTGGQEKIAGSMFSGRSGPQVIIETNISRMGWLKHAFRDLHR